LPSNADAFVARLSLKGHNEAVMTVTGYVIKVTESSAENDDNVFERFQELPLASNSGEYIANAGYP
jgi:hypothetical protein